MTKPRKGRAARRADAPPFARELDELIARARREAGDGWGPRDEHARALGHVVLVAAYFQAAHLETLRKLESVWHAQEELSAARADRARWGALLGDAIRWWRLEAAATARRSSDEYSNALGPEPPTSLARARCVGAEGCRCSLCRLFSTALLGPDERPTEDPRPERYGAF